LPFIMIAGQQFDPGLQILDLQRTVRVQPSQILFIDLHSLVAVGKHITSAKLSDTSQLDLRHDTYLFSQTELSLCDPVLVSSSCC
jgi:hypothetical protein